MEHRLYTAVAAVKDNTDEFKF
uniref:Uncharacterized protein n=1 Tax=Anguilla anguilla TaxID=7936 RepID=A0A0E9Q062_ANGAN